MKNPTIAPEPCFTEGVTLVKGMCETVNIVGRPNGGA